MDKLSKDHFETVWNHFEPIVSLKEKVLGNGTYQQVGHKGFGHERKIFLILERNKKKWKDRDGKWMTSENINQKPLSKFQLALRREGMDGPPVTEQY